ncbi:MAG: hypothetical protein PHE38_14375 [Alishewanella agri]|nr:hypothetical protein [Alishewanella agri]
MQIKCTGDNGVTHTVKLGHPLIGKLLDKEFNIGVGKGTERALLAQQSLYDTGRLRLKKIKVTLEKLPK